MEVQKVSVSCISRSLAWLRLEWQICGECDWQMQMVQAAYFKHTHTQGTLSKQSACI